MNALVSQWTALDRIVDVQPGHGARALRNVPNTLAILDTHFPRFPVLPGVLILGSLAELAALFLEKQTGRRWQLSRATEIRFRHYVRPGDQLELAVELKQLLADAATLHGSVWTEGRLTTSVRELRLVPRGLTGSP